MTVLVFCFSSVLYLLWHLVRCGIISVDPHMLIRILRMDKWWVNSFNFFQGGGRENFTYYTECVTTDICTVWYWLESEVSNSKHILLQNFWCFRKFYCLWFEQWNFVILLSCSQLQWMYYKVFHSTEIPLLSDKWVLSFCRNIFSLNVESFFFF